MSSLDDTLQANVRNVLGRIDDAARRAGRPAGSIALLAVSKTFDAAAVVAAARCGLRSFGENYAQEADAKIDAVAAIDPALAAQLRWHFIGPLQSNKTRRIAERFDWVQSVDRLALARRLSEQRPPGRPPLDVLLQVNVSGEATKRGVAPAEAGALAREVAALPGLRLRGLMAIPAPEADPQRERAAFRAMRGLYDELRAGGLALDTLSMGMSADLDVAIAEGATMVRVGTAIFGERK